LLCAYLGIQRIPFYEIRNDRWEASPLRIQRADLSATCRSAADAAAAGQQRTKTLVGIELGGLVLAGFAGLQSVRVGGLDVLAAAAGVLFLANRHERAARIWLIVSVTASAGGVVAAAMRMLGLIDVDVLGVAAAVATAAIAWNQLNQNRNLVAAYRLTARELSIIRDRVANVDEASWAAFVSDAEDAVSREHTMWLARHGHPGLRILE
jgi:hypothetical protein